MYIARAAVRIGGMNTLKVGNKVYRLVPLTPEDRARIDPGVHDDPSVAELLDGTDQAGRLVILATGRAARCLGAPESPDAKAVDALLRGYEMAIAISLVRGNDGLSPADARRLVEGFKTGELLGAAALALRVTGEYIQRVEEPSVDAIKRLMTLGRLFIDGPERAHELQAR